MVLLRGHPVWLVMGSVFHGDKDFVRRIYTLVQGVRAFRGRAVRSRAWFNGSLIVIRGKEERRDIVSDEKEPSDVLYKSSPP